MNILKSIFKSSKEKNISDPDISFGRYSDAYKDKSKYASWDLATEYFMEQEYMNSYLHFFEYLTDSFQNNVKLDISESLINFKILQGSKLIQGKANNLYFKAEAKIAKVKHYNQDFLKRLLEKNFSLKYGQFALDKENNITIVFYTKTIDASPYKIYYALRELATQADKHDDILEGEFDSLIAINKEHIKKTASEEKKIKYSYFKNQINNAFDILDHSNLNFDNYPGAASFVLLDTIYKLDYLIKPEGYIMESFEKIHRTFFDKNGTTAIEKNNHLRNNLQSLLNRSREEFDEEIYGVVSTFGITMPSGNDRFVDMVESELKNINWYLQNDHHDVALSIMGYIVGYCHFNYSLPIPIRSLMFLYYRILENDFFCQLGFREKFIVKNELSKTKINNSIISIINQYKIEYGLKNPNIKAIIFDTKVEFARSYLIMLSDLFKTKKIDNI